MSEDYSYINYTKDSLEKAIRDVTFQSITLRKASEKHGVPRNTISSHVACCNVNTGIVECLIVVFFRIKVSFFFFKLYYVPIHP